jgi:GntR family transcriptional repressor for pyruvate dehydrogenase complex
MRSSTDSTPPPSFEAVRKVRRYEQVAEQIRRLIGSGALKPGDLLPPERELAARLGVGRSSIRDAVRTLEVMGILEPRQGHGTVVRDLNADALVVPLSLVLTRKRELVTELLDVRRMIEPGLAARAAKNATDEEIARMAEILERHEAKPAAASRPTRTRTSTTRSLAARNGVVLRIKRADGLLREPLRALQVGGRALVRRTPPHPPRHPAARRQDRGGRGAAAPGN